MKCHKCQVDYPEDLVSVMHSTDVAVHGKNFCGICALEEKNRIHGTHFKTFVGRTAEKMRKDAIKWREHLATLQERSN